MKARRWMTHVGVVIGIVASGVAAPCIAQECPKIVGSERWGTWGERLRGEPFRLEVTDTYLFLVQVDRYCFRSKLPVGGCNTAYPWELVIFDVSDPTGPVMVGNFDLGDDARDISVAGSLVYTLSHGLNIFDISNPRDPEELLWRFEYDGEPSEIFVTGEHAYITVTDGLRIFDVSVPDQPFEVGFFPSQWEPTDLIVMDGHAYVTVPNLGLRIIDVSNPANPFEVGSYSTTWDAHDLELSGGIAFVADGGGGVRVLDVTDPSAPLQIGVIATAGPAWNVSVDGSIASVALAGNGVEVFNVSNPASLERVSMYQSEGAAWDVSVLGTMLYVATGLDLGTPPHIRLGEGEFSGGFGVVDIAAPDWPIEKASIEFEAIAMDVDVSEDFVGAARGDLGVWIRDHGWLDTPGFARGITLSGHLALVADGHKGIRFIELADPDRISEVGFFDTPGTAHRVAVDGHHAFVADGESGLQVIDFQWLSNPQEVGHLDTPGEALDVALTGDYAYVADGYGGLRIIDVSDPAAPFEVSAPQFITYAESVAVARNVVFVASHAALLAFEVSDPESPTPLRNDPLRNDPPYGFPYGFFFGLRGDGTGIALSGAFVFVSTRDSDGIEVIDISDPDQPAAAGRCPVSGHGSGIAALGGELYLAHGMDGLTVLDSRCLTTYWVDVVAHQRGLDGSNWRSDVVVNHRPWAWVWESNKKASADVAVELRLHTSEGVLVREAAVGREGQGVFEDVVGLFDFEGMGALEVRSEIPLIVSSRVYNQTASGTVGGYHPGYRISEGLDDYEIAYLFGLRQEEGEYRTNISITNTGSERSTAEITLYRSGGQELVRYYVSVEAGAVLQELQPFKKRANLPNVGWGFAKIQASSGSLRRECGLLASASVIDARTGDAVMVPMTR